MTASEISPTAAQCVSLSYEELCSDADLSDKIEQAYGQDGLGILTVSGVPNYPELRQALLPLAAEVAALPACVLSQLEDAASSFNFGWSHGREALSDGQLDTHKGSFYANPLTDRPVNDPALAAAHPAYYRPNVWPAEALPGLEAAFKALGAAIVEAGLRLTAHCNRFVSSRNPAVPPGKLVDILARSRCPKARLLHYFPTDGTAAASDSGAADNWCGWHLDHGSLTGLTCALYSRGGCPVPCPDPAAGLYIRDRRGRLIKVNIPADHVAFQMGESMQVHSGGLLRATPHCVHAAGDTAAAGVSRQTFAVFMQPDVFEPMDAPAGCSAADVAVGQWQPGDNFGQFSERTFAKYYGTAM